MSLHCCAIILPTLYTLWDSPMHITGRELTVKWKILSEPVVPTISYFDVLVHRPDGSRADHLSALYLDSPYSPATSGSYVVSYTFTPDVSGVWVVKLVSGDSSAYTVHNTVNLTLHLPDTEVYQQVVLRNLDPALSTQLSGTYLQ